MLLFMISPQLQPDFCREDAMPAVNAQNFEAVLTPDMRDEFWRRVKFSLRHFFGETEDLADRYRDMVEADPIGQQLLASAPVWSVWFCEHLHP